MTHTSNNDSNLKHREHHFAVEQRPRMLKDFLFDDSNSRSYSGFKSFPRKPLDFSTRNLIHTDLKNTRRSRTASAFQVVINAFKNIHVRPPSILPRTLSLRLSKKGTCSETKTTVVTIKDIMRWKSFRDLVEEKSPSSTATATTTSSSPCCSSNGSSWCDSDFTTSESWPWNGNSDEFEVSKKYLPGVGEDDDSKQGPTGVGATLEEKQQNSPISVIDIEFEEDESNSSFDQSLATMERTKQKLMQKIRRFESLARIDPVNLETWMSMDENITTSSAEGNDGDDGEVREINTSYEEEEKEEETNDEVEEKAWNLLNHVRETSSFGEQCKDNVVNRLVLDFFRDELSRNKGYDHQSGRHDCEMLSRVKSWVDGELSTWIGWDKKEAYGRDMGKWRKFEEEQQELGLEIENGMLCVLIDELLFDLIS